MAEENTTPQPPENTTAPEPPATPAVSEAEQALTVKIAELVAAVADKEAVIVEAKKTLDARAADYSTLKTTFDEAVKSYRKLAVGSNPLFTEELISGATIAEIESSVTRAAALVGKVRSKIEEDLKNLSIPAGAPERSGPDTSGYSPREKIAAGIRKQNK